MLKALTLWQPWAWAMGIGLKRIENRPWEPPASLMGERFALHAGKRWDPESEDMLRDRLYLPDDPAPPVAGDDVAHGAVIAVTRLVAVVTSAEAAARIGGGDQGRWFLGPYGWVVENTVTLPEPVPCRGHQKLWTLPKDVEDDVFFLYR